MTNTVFLFHHVQQLPKEWVVQDKPNPAHVSGNKPRSSQKKCYATGFFILCDSPRPSVNQKKHETINRHLNRIAYSTERTSKYVSRKISHRQCILKTCNCVCVCVLRRLKRCWVKATNAKSFICVLHLQFFSFKRRGFIENVSTAAE